MDRVAESALKEYKADWHRVIDIKMFFFAKASPSALLHIQLIDPRSDLYHFALCPSKTSRRHYNIDSKSRSKRR